MNQLTPTPETIDSSSDVGSSYLGHSIIDIHRREVDHAFVSERLCLTDALSGLLSDGTDDHNLLIFMPVLKRLYECITSCDSPPVELVKHKRDATHKYKQPTYKLTKVGTEVLLACRAFSSQVERGWDWQKACAGRKFHPIIEVTLHAVLHWQNAICEWQHQAPFVVQFKEEQEAVDALHRLVNHVRRESRSQAFRNALHDLDRKATDNFRSACDLVAKLFALHARLLVLRIDLYIRLNAKVWGYTEGARKALGAYLRDLREGRIVPGYLKFLIKEEDAIRRGKHFHLMVFLDGHQHRHTYHLTKLLGEAWKKRVGLDKGAYFNCYARKHSYRYNGLGLVHVSDKEKLIGLRIALWYMTKRDTILPMVAAKHRSFWGSTKSAGDSKRGAPRKDGDGMELVKRMLGGKRSVYPKGFEPPKRSVARPVVTESLAADA
ncbi:inovirus-type Gp2 protein [Dyella flava]|uniref:Inovirus-type Gp2 protein n=1 Tax=Dyella flava TaxID=1920170 RepID=A0ABS2JZH6_9GAMM|nr:inovirus-type Gp2 protein [Dyella flava]MBM7124409.1 inovirus-type Gp2 protein [Dyella flava]GLQ52498.1 hypothetical protein GCM10010872_39470 [Dyella flava]